MALVSTNRTCAADLGKILVSNQQKKQFSFFFFISQPTIYNVEADIDKNTEKI